MRTPGRRSNRLGLLVLGIFLLLLAGASTAAFKTLTFVSAVSTASLGDNIRSIVTTTVPASRTSSQAGSSGSALPPRINVLLLGYGGNGHDGSDLTDSIMVLTLDQRTKKAAMISVPRDIWVRIPSNGDQGGFWKINTAYPIGLDDQGYPNKKPQFRGQAGGGNLASAVVGGILGMKIDYWVAVDFRAFRSMVNALGGVDVNVQTAFTDYRYPRNDNPKIDASYMTIHFNAGMQHMNGERAIEFARSRHSLQDGTDFGRSRRQQLLLLAIKNKALSKAGLTKAFSVMDALSRDFRTNMTIGQVRTLAEMAKGINLASIQRVSIDNTNFLLDARTANGQDVLVPRGGSWRQLQTHIAKLLMDPAVLNEKATVQVWNGSGLPGVAGNASVMLQDAGLTTFSPQNLNGGSRQTQVRDFSQGRAPATVSYLAGLFGASVVTEPPAANGQAEVQLILGKSYELALASIASFDPSLLPLNGGAVQASASQPAVSQSSIVPRRQPLLTSSARTAAVASRTASARVVHAPSIQPHGSTISSGRPPSGSLAVAGKPAAGTTSRAAGPAGSAASGRPAAYGTASASGPGTGTAAGGTGSGATKAPAATAAYPAANPGTFGVPPANISAVQVTRR